MGTHLLRSLLQIQSVTNRGIEEIDDYLMIKREVDTNHD